MRRQGKDNYCTGVVVLVDFSGKIKRILFHFPKVSSKYDEWIQFGSDRIARLNTLAVPNERKRKEKKGKKEKDKKKDGKKGPNSADTKKSSLQDPGQAKRKRLKTDGKPKKRRKSTSHQNGTVSIMEESLTESAKKSVNSNMAAESDFALVTQANGEGSEHISDMNVVQMSTMAAIDEPPVICRTNAPNHWQTHESIQQTIPNSVHNVEAAPMNNASNGYGFTSIAGASVTDGNYPGNQSQHSHVATGSYNCYIRMQQQQQEQEQQQQMNGSTFGVHQYQSSLYPLSQNNIASMQQNYNQVVSAPITQTMSAESAAYELLLLSSAARERSNFANSALNAGRGLGMGAAAPNTTNRAQQPGGLRMFTTGQPNADGSFTPLQQQGVFHQATQHNPVNNNSNNLAFFLNAANQSGLGPNRFNM